MILLNLRERVALFFATWAVMALPIGIILTIQQDKNFIVLAVGGGVILVLEFSLGMACLIVRWIHDAPIPDLSDRPPGPAITLGLLMVIGGSLCAAYINHLWCFILLLCIVCVPPVVLLVVCLGVYRRQFVECFYRRV